MSNKDVSIDDAIIEAKTYVRKGHSASRGAVEQILLAFEEANRQVEDGSINANELLRSLIVAEGRLKIVKETLRKVDDAYERYWASAEAYIQELEKDLDVVKTEYNEDTGVRERVIAQPETFHGIRPEDITPELVKRLGIKRPDPEQVKGLSIKKSDD